MTTFVSIGSSINTCNSGTNLNYEECDECDENVRDNKWHSI